MGEKDKAAPNTPAPPEETKKADGAIPAFVPFTPPRVAGVWVLGPNGPQRKE